MQDLVICKAGPSLGPALVPFALLAACLLPPFAIVCAIGLGVSAFMVASGFRATETETR